MVMVRELREAWRRLIRRPGYALLSVVVLGVGLGVVLFLFNIINAAILRPMPFPQVDRLMTIGKARTNFTGPLDSAQYLALRGHLESVDAMGAWQPVVVRLDAGHGATLYSAARLSASMLKLTGATPIRGRGFRPGDDKPGAPRVALIGASLWRNVFASDPHIVGRKVRMGDHFYTVIGVLPKRYGFPRNQQLWFPLRLQPGQHQGVFTLAQLAPGADLTKARAELATWATRLARVLPPDTHAKPVVIAPLRTHYMPRDEAHWAWLMFAAAALVLLLACVNVANLQLVRTLQRRHELALRSALGSSRMRLVLGALAESLWLSMAALAVAFPIALAGNHWFEVTWIAQRPDTVASFVNLAMGPRAIAFAVGVALLCTLIAGGIPAWRAARANLEQTLRDGGKSSGSGFARIAKVMVVIEVMLTVVLLVGAGTFVGAIHRLLAQPTVGAAHADHVLTASVALPASRYASDAEKMPFYDRVVEQLRRDPQVINATASNTVPGAVLGSHEDVSLPGHPEPSAGWRRAQMGIVGPHFLDTYGVRLLQGRFFDARDTAAGQQVAVIDAKMAAKFWPHTNPLNRTFVLYPGKPYAKTLTVVGVIQPLQLDDMLEKSLPGMLIPLTQANGDTPFATVGFAVRVRGKAMAYQHALVDAVHAVDPQVAVYQMQTQAHIMQMNRLGLNLLTDVFAALGLIALLLAAAGLYGVLAFSVEQRTRDIGIRRAIGASGGSIVRLVMHQLAWQLGIGLVAGIALAVPWIGMLSGVDGDSLGLQTHSPQVFVTVIALVVVMSAIAALVPLVRALRVDPVVALRHE